MRRPRRHRPLMVALYVNAALMAAVLIAVLSRGNSILPAAYAALPAPQPIAGGANLYLMPAQFNGNTWGCYILDIDSQTLCAYRYKPKNDGADLELVAARKITYDRKLTNFNSGHPSWQEVKQWVDQAAEGVRGQSNTDKKDTNQRESSTQGNQ